MSLSYKQLSVTCENGSILIGTASTSDKAAAELEDDGAKSVDHWLLQEHGRSGRLRSTLQHRLHVHRRGLCLKQNLI
jgi:hypothetical protein